ncbi:LytTR family transcriptional regulator [Lacihabitans sp. LS3-19]|uniref:LytR/AlgR family response regulator transcription factor n=1 Tax=Lacihabitans sp. LS3-19 TaxID=2487335 RepID=UPI0020CF7E7C|nr:LytTR family DNA-binding domain-containing protein [Lacihabitans sp. LS3-19]MCP9766509.1 LytTR family transcriptional regulator [Lacihabitans sp. LS3-19]
MKNILVKIGSRTKVNPIQVVALFAVDNYSKTLLSTGQVILTSTHLGLLEERFNSENFFRINRSSVINFNYLKSYDEKNFLFAKLKNNLELKISRRKRKDFKMKLDEIVNA